MNWNDLTTEQQAKWNDFAENHQDEIKKVSVLRPCLYCPYNSTSYENQKFHLHTTHGFPADVVDELTTNPTPT